MLRSIRLAGLQGLRALVLKTIDDVHNNNIWLELGKIIPALLFIMQNETPARSADAPLDDVVDPSASATESIPMQRLRTSAQPAGPIGAEQSIEENNAAQLAQQCLRDIARRASVGNMKDLLKPIIDHMDSTQSWSSNRFALEVFGIVMYSVQAQYYYIPVMEVLAHLNVRLHTSATKSGIIGVLSHIVGIAKGSYGGPGILQAFDILLRHVCLSVEAQLCRSHATPAVAAATTTASSSSASSVAAAAAATTTATATGQPLAASRASIDTSNHNAGTDVACAAAAADTDDEARLQQAIIDCIGLLTQYLPDYQQVEAMVFILAKLPPQQLLSIIAGAPGRPAAPACVPSTVYLAQQRMLLRCLLCAAESCSPMPFDNVFTMQLCDLLLSALVASDAEVRFLSLDILRTLLGIARAAGADVAALPTSIPASQRTFQRRIRWYMFEAATLVDGHANGYLALYRTQVALLRQFGYTELFDVVRYSLALQTYALDRCSEQDSVRGAFMHALVAALLFSIAHVSRNGAMQTYVLSVATKRRAVLPFAQVSVEFDLAGPASQSAESCVKLHAAAASVVSALPAAPGSEGMADGAKASDAAADLTDMLFSLSTIADLLALDGVLVKCRPDFRELLKPYVHKHMPGSPTMQRLHHDLPLHPVPVIVQPPSPKARQPSLAAAVSAEVQDLSTETAPDSGSRNTGTSRSAASPSTLAPTARPDARVPTSREPNDPTKPNAAAGAGANSMAGSQAATPKADNSTVDSIGRASSTSGRSRSTVHVEQFRSIFSAQSVGDSASRAPESPASPATGPISGLTFDDVVHAIETSRPTRQLHVAVAIRYVPTPRVVQSRARCRVLTAPLLVGTRQGSRAAPGCAFTLRTRRPPGAAGDIAVGSVGSAGVPAARTDPVRAVTPVSRRVRAVTRRAGARCAAWHASVDRSAHERGARTRLASSFAAAAAGAAAAAAHACVRRRGRCCAAIVYSSGMAAAATTTMGRVALVTGGSSGIGRAVVQRFRRDGLRVAVADLERQEARAAAEADGALFVPADLSRRADCRAAVDRVVSQYGALDVLVNNAGLQHLDAVERFPEDQWDTMVAVMLTAPFLLSKYAWSHLQRTGHGRIVNIGSIHSQVASPFKVAYVSCKHGLVGMTRTLALEGGSAGITANCVCPAYVRTPLVDRQLVQLAEARGVSVEAALQSVMLEPAAIKRLLEADDVASMVSYVVSEAAWGVTGAVLNMDLGWTAR